MIRGRHPTTKRSKIFYYKLIIKTSEQTKKYIDFFYIFLFMYLNASLRDLTLTSQFLNTSKLGK